MTEPTSNDATPPQPPDLLGGIVAALNADVVPQLRHLANGPLATAAADALRLALEQHQPIAASVLQVRVMIEGRLYTIGVQLLVSP